MRACKYAPKDGVPPSNAKKKFFLRTFFHERAIMRTAVFAEGNLWKLPRGEVAELYELLFAFTAWPSHGVPNAIFMEEP